MKTTLATVVVGAAVVNGIFQNHEVCRDTLQEHTLCTEGGVCDCAAFTAEHGCGGDAGPIERTLEPDFVTRCDRNQLVTDIVRIAAREGQDMIEKCWILKEAIENTGKAPANNKLNCACIGVIPEDEYAGALNCKVNEKFHGWHAYNLCQSINLGRRRADVDESVFDDQVGQLSIEEAYEEVHADPELLSIYKARKQRRRLSSWAKTTTWKNILTSGVDHHYETGSNGEVYEAYQSGVCNATCGACGDSAMAPTPLTDLTDMAENAVSAAVERVESQLNKFGYTDADWMALSQQERNQIRRKYNKNN